MPGTKKFACVVRQERFRSQFPFEKKLKQIHIFIRIVKKIDFLKPPKQAFSLNHVIYE